MRRNRSLRFLCLLFALPVSAWAGTSVYTKQEVVPKSMSVDAAEQQLISEIRQEAIDKTGAYVKKTSVMDSYQNLSESTSVTLASLIKIAVIDSSLELTKTAPISQVLTIKARVDVDDDGIKKLVAGEDALEAERAKSRALAAKLADVIKEKNRPATTQEQTLMTQGDPVPATTPANEPEPKIGSLEYAVKYGSMNDPLLASNPAYIHAIELRNAQEKLDAQRSRSIPLTLEEKRHLADVLANQHPVHYDQIPLTPEEDRHLAEVRDHPIFSQFKTDMHNALATNILTCWWVPGVHCGKP